MKPAAIPRATIRSAATGALIAGPVVQDHGDGSVTIQFAGMLRPRGQKLTAAQIAEIEACTTPSSPDSREPGHD